MSVPSFFFSLIRFVLTLQERFFFFCQPVPGTGSRDTDLCFFLSSWLAYESCVNTSPPIPIPVEAAAVHFSRFSRSLVRSFVRSFLVKLGRTLSLREGRVLSAVIMANRGTAQRPNGSTQGKICQFKLVLLGESAVGKSSLVLRFVKGQFHEYQESTIGAAFLTQTVCLDDTTVKFEIWDTAGQERYHSLAPMYYRGAQAAIVVYDITNQDTFVRAQTWVKELQRQASPSIVIALAGNKADLVNKRVVEFDEAQTYADENGLLFMETSAKTAMNVNDIFLAIAKKLPKNEQSGSASTSGQGRRLVETEGQKAGTGNCCK